MNEASPDAVITDREESSPEEPQYVNTMYLLVSFVSYHGVNLLNFLHIQKFWRELIT